MPLKFDGLRIKSLQMIPGHLGKPFKNFESKAFQAKDV
jgi:hypothetical protein